LCCSLPLLHRLPLTSLVLFSGVRMLVKPNYSPTTHGAALVAFAQQILKQVCVDYVCA
jgi:hypothetical protein